MQDKQELISQALLHCEKLYYKPVALSLDPSLATYPGQLLIERALQSKTKSYRIADTKSEWVRKTIVLSDWSLNNKAEEIKKEVLNLLNALLIAGFDVQYWDGNQLVKLNPGVIENKLKLIRALPKKSFERLKQQSQASDALFNLDYFELRQLLLDLNLPAKAYHKKKSYVLDVGDLLPFKTIPKEILQWLKDKIFTLKLGDRHLRDSIEEEKKIFILLLKLFPEKINRVISNQNSDITLFEHLINCKDIEAIIWKENYLQQIRDSNIVKSEQMQLIFPKLKKLDLLLYEMPATVVSELLENADQLQSLSISGRNNLRSLKLSSHKNFNTLQKLKLSHACLSTDMISKLCGSIALRYLQMENCEIGGEVVAQLKANENVFLNLTRLKLTNVTLSSSALEFILHQSHKLEELEIYHCKGFSGFNIKPKHIGSLFANLKQLSIMDSCDLSSDLSFKAVVSILSCANKLEGFAIDYRRDSKKTPDLIPNDLQLPRLNDIAVRVSTSSHTALDVPIGTYLKLISCAPLIKQIDLVGVSNLNDTYHSDSLSIINQLNLEHIESIDASSSTITSKQLIRILNQTRNVRSILLKSCSLANLTSEDIADNIIFKHLETLDVSETAIRGDTLAKLISKAPNLKVVIADKCKDLGKSFNISQLADAENIKLQKFSAKNVKMFTSESLWLLKRCESIGFKSNLDSESIANDVVFHNLTEIRNAEMNDSTFLKIMAKAPNLTIVHGEVNWQEEEQFSFSQYNDGLRFNKLKEFSISGLKIPLNEYLWLLTRSSKITTFDLQHINQYQEVNEKVLQQIQLPQIKELLVTHTQKYCFGKILKILPNVEFIVSTEETDSYATTITAEDIPHDLHLPQLKSLDLSYLSISGEAVLKLLKASPNLEDLNLTGCTSCDLTVSLMQGFPLEKLRSFAYATSSLSLASIIKFATLLEDNDKHLISHSKITLTKDLFKAYKHSTPTFTLTDKISFPFVKSIMIEDVSSIDEIFFTQLISATPNVESICLNNINFKESKSTQLPKMLPFLEYLTITNTTVSANIIECLISIAPQLKVIDIVKDNNSSAGKSDSLTLANNIKFDNLQKIKINNNCISCNFIHQVIAKAKNLESLNLEAMPLGKIKMRTLIYPQFFKMAELSILASYIDTELTKQILFTATNLKTIRIATRVGGCFEGFNKLLQSNKILSGVTELNLENQELPGNFLQNIFYVFPNLQLLKLENCELINKVYGVSSALKLLSLKNITIKNTNIDFSDMLNLVANVESLEIITIEACQLEIFIQQQRERLDNSSFNLSKLKNLSLKDTKIDYLLFIRLLIRAFYVEHLNLYGLQLKNFSKTDDFFRLPFTKLLTAFDYEKSNLPVDLLLAVYAQNTKLTDLKLINRVLKMPSVEPKFSGVEQLTLEGSTLDYELFRCLIANPFIKNLNVNSITLTNLPATLSDDKFCLSNLESFSYEKSNLPEATIVAIYKSSAGQSSKLKTLSLTNFTIFKMDLNFPQLESIDFTASSMDFSAFISLLSRNKLNMLKANSLELTNIPKTYDYSALNLNYIPKFEFANSNIPLELICSLFKSGMLWKHFHFEADLVRNMDFLSYDGMKSTQIMSNPLIKIPLVTRINLLHSRLSAEHILILLCGAEELSSLTIHASSINEKLSPINLMQLVENNRCKKLEVLNFSSQTISGELLLAILMLAPNLKKIVFIDVKIVDLKMEDIPSNLILNELLEFTLVNSGLTDAVIKRLHSCAPNLTAINTKNGGSLREYNFSLSNHPYFRRLPNNSGAQSYSSNLGKHDCSESTSKLDELELANNFAKILSSNWKLPETIATAADHLTEKPSHNPSKDHEESSSKFNLSTSSNVTSVVQQTNHGGRSYSPMEEVVKITSNDPRSGFDVKQNAKEFFVTNPYIHPRMYRLQSYVLKIQGNSIIVVARKPKILSYPSSEIHFLKSPVRNQFKQLGNHPRRHAFFDDELMISSQWSVIPSLYAGEAIVDFYCDFPGEYEIKYAPQEKFYYIRAKNFCTPRSIKASFTLNFDRAHRVAKQFNKEIQSHIERCSDFHESNLDIAANVSEMEILDARYEQQIGSCENRSIVLDYKLTKLFTDPENSDRYKKFDVSIIRNRLHAFIEIDETNACYQIDLGGYEANVELEKIEKFDLAPVEKIEEKLLEVKREVPEPVAQQAKIAPYQNKAAEKIPEPPKKKIITEADLCPELITWKKSPKDLPKTAEELFKQIIRPGEKSLLKVQEPDDCLKIVASFAEKIKKPFLFIDSPDDLQWKAPGLKFNKSLGKDILGLKKCFSKLRYFLETYPDGVLFINWSNFSNTEIAGLHSVIDEKRQLEGEDLPLQLPIVGFYCDHLPNAYNDADFTTRHDYVYPEWSYELTADLFHNCKKETSIPAKDEACIIDLFESEDWEALLFGAIHIHKNLFSMEFSEFPNQLENKAIALSHLHIKNPPWHLREFQLFWQHALQQKSFSLYGRSFSLEQQFQLSYSYNYEFKTDFIQKNINEENIYSYPLNTHTLHEFFPHYIYQQPSFVRTPGILQAFKNQLLTLVVTEGLTKNQWSRLLTEANNNNTRLKIKLAHNVKLPVELGNVAYQEFKPEAIPLEKNLKEHSQSCTVIYAKESIDEISSELLAQYPDAIYVSLDSTHDFGDLFYQIHPSTSEDGILARFINSDIWLALLAEKTVILEGRLPATLINALSPLFVSGKSELIIHGEAVPFKGRLLIVTDQEIHIAVNQFHYKSAPNQKEKILNPIKLDTSTKTEETSVDNPNDLSEEAYLKYKSQRFNNIANGFQQSPIIAYTGPTGIGKTTYIIKEFEEDYLKRTGRHAKLYVGEGQMEAFAAHKNPDIDPFLFIDEANLSDQKLSVLKGLTSKKPHLLKNSHYYNLQNRNKPHQTQHRVILACNLKEYAGGVRQQEEFFTEHAAIVKCNKPNNAYLYHEILKPQLMNIHHQQQLAKILLTVFDKINEVAQTLNAFVSPRHLHMMTVLSLAYLKKNKDADIKSDHLAISACLAILGDSLTTAKHRKLLQFLKNKYGYEQNQFAIKHSKIIEDKIIQLNKSRKSNFSFTKSRLPILSMLDLFLSLRTQANFHFGLLIEGDSAEGKSTLVRKYLELLGIDYFQFTFSNKYQTDCRLLLEAYYSRKAIVIDELNAGGQVYERLINTLVMGTEQEINDIAKNIMPDEYQQRIQEYENGKTQNKPRSVIIATQNSLSLAGRQALTIAMQARFVSLSVPNYPPEELKQILVERGVREEAAKTWVAAYMLNTAYAVFHRLEPKPNLRDLLKAAGVAHLEHDKSQTEPSKQLIEVQQRLEQTGLEKDFTKLDFSNAELVNLFCDHERSSPEQIDLINELAEEATLEDKSETIVPSANESLAYDKEVLQDVKEKIELLQNKIEMQSNREKNNRRQCKIKFLIELKDKLECNELNDRNLDELSKSTKYKSLFGFFINNEMDRFRDHFKQSIDITAQAKKMNLHSSSKYVFDKGLLADLKAYAEKLHTEFNNDRHAFLADRRWQKYTALRKVIRLYEANQLTKKHISLIESQFSKMYDGFFSQKTFDLMDRVKTSIGINTAYMYKAIPGAHSGARVYKVAVEPEKTEEASSQIDLDIM